MFWLLSFDLKDCQAMRCCAEEGKGWEKKGKTDEGRQGEYAIYFLLFLALAPESLLLLLVSSSSDS